MSGAKAAWGICVQARRVPTLLPSMCMRAAPVHHQPRPTPGCLPACPTCTHPPCARTRALAPLLHASPAHPPPPCPHHPPAPPPHHPARAAAGHHQHQQPARPAGGVQNQDHGAQEVCGPPQQRRGRAAQQRVGAGHHAGAEGVPGGLCQLPRQVHDPSDPAGRGGGGRQGQVGLGCVGWGGGGGGVQGCTCGSTDWGVHMHRLHERREQQHNRHHQQYHQHQQKRQRRGRAS